MKAEDDSLLITPRVEWCVDFGKSGTTFRQPPDYQRLKRAVESKPQFHRVVCYDESRWGRAIDAEENNYWRVCFQRRGVVVILVKTGARRDLGQGGWSVKKQEKVLWVLGDASEVEVVKTIFEKRVKKEGRTSGCCRVYRRSYQRLPVEMRCC